MKKVLSLDAETNSLTGKAFAIGARLYDNDILISEFIGRCPIRARVDSWVEDNVLPVMENIPINYNNYCELLKAFMEYYMENKKDADVIVHMGVPVESKLFTDAQYFEIIGDFDAPYPLIDISCFPDINVSVDDYNTKYNIIIPSFDGGTHNPLYDCTAAAMAYSHYLNMIKSNLKRRV